MAQLYHQASQQGIWTVLGAPTACAVQLAQPLTITYADGTTQTLPAHTPAVTGTSATQVDRTSAVWVVYALKGETVPTLHLAKEQDLATLSTDYAPLGRVLADRVQVYQPQPGGGSGGAGLTAEAALEYVLDGGGSALAVGAAGSLVVPFDGTLTACTLLADQSGSLVLDLAKATYSTYPTAGSIVAGAPPTITSAQKSQDTTLSGWATAIAAGDVLLYSVTSAASITRCTVVLDVTRLVSSTTINWAGVPLAQVAHNGDTTIPSGGAGTTISFPGLYADQGTGTPQYSSAAPDRLTCQQAGWYQVSAWVTWTFPSALSGSVWCAITQTAAGGTTPLDSVEVGVPFASATQLLDQTPTGLFQLSGGDYLQVVLQQNTGSALVANRLRLSLVRVA